MQEKKNFSKNFVVRIDYAIFSQTLIFPTKILQTFFLLKNYKDDIKFE